MDLISSESTTQGLIPMDLILSDFLKIRKDHVDIHFDFKLPADSRITGHDIQQRVTYHEMIWELFLEIMPKLIEKIQKKEEGSISITEFIYAEVKYNVCYGWIINIIGLDEEKQIDSPSCIQFVKDEWNKLYCCMQYFPQKKKNGKTKL